MTIELAEEPMTALPEYARIPIVFTVDRVFDVTSRADASGGFELSERRLDAPYQKDYDAVAGEGPLQWPRRFDLSNWKIFIARPGMSKATAAPPTAVPDSHDVKAAVRWMRSHAAEYGIDPQVIGAIGGSAGAHLVAMLATTGAEQFEGDGGNGGTSSEVQAVVAMGGAYDLEPKGDVGREFISAVTKFIDAPLEAHAAAVAAASPARHVSRRSAPLLLLHSTTDPVAPFARAVEMEQSYRRAGAPVTLKAIDAPGLHGFWGDPRYFPEALRHAVDFLHRYLRMRR